MNERNLLIIGGIGIAGIAIYMGMKGGNLTTLTSKLPQGFNAMTGNDDKGYSNMMKLSPNYYAPNNIGGANTNLSAFNTSNIQDSWALPAEGNVGMSINKSWTDDPDTYSAKLAEMWITELATTL
jgi:hypothetical protein